jgi:hypothetical protein
MRTTRGFNKAVRANANYAEATAAAGEFLFTIPRPRCHLYVKSAEFDLSFY